MKNTWLLLTALLLIPSALALQKPALEKTDFKITNQIREKRGELLVSITAKGEKALNVTVAPTNSFIEKEKRTFLISEGEVKKTVWKIVGEAPPDYDFSNAFEVISWDNTTQLKLDPVPEQTNQKTIEISGKTDPAVQCGQSDKCRTKILVNEKELGKADENGDFSFDYDLKEGKNQLEIVAEDPGGNQNIQTKTTTYAIPFYQKYQWPLMGAGLLLALFAAIIIGVIVKKSTEKEIGETKRELTEKELEKLKEKENQLLIQYERSGGMKVNMKELKDVWRQIIEQDPEFQEFIKKEANRITEKSNWKKQIQEKEKSYMKKINEIDEQINKRSGGVKSTMLENYVTVLKKQLKKQIKKKKLS